MADKVRNIALAVLAGLALAASVAYWYWNSPRINHWPARRKATCYNNLTQIELALRTWSRANGGQFPWGVSTNDGGTMEFCAPGPDGFDRCAAIHFEVMSNELSTTRLLICPRDQAKTAATNFHNLRPENVTYRLHTGTNGARANPKQALVVCPIDGNTLYLDWTVSGKPKEPADDSLGQPMQIPQP
jgi:hypothetical protein